MTSLCGVSRLRFNTAAESATRIRNKKGRPKPPLRSWKTNGLLAVQRLRRFDISLAGHAFLDLAAIAGLALDGDLGARAADLDRLAADHDLTAAILDAGDFALDIGHGWRGAQRECTSQNG